jgi:hypothetical protein
MRTLVGTLVLAAALGGALPAVAQETIGPDRIVVPLSDPTRPATVHVDLVNGGIVVEAYPGKEIIVEARGRSGGHGEKHAAETRDGMRRIPNLSLGLTVEEEGNEVSVESESWQRPIDIRLQVPIATALKLACVNDGDIEVRGVAGELELENVNGAISVHDASGSVVAETVNGGIKVNFLKVAPERAMAFSTLNGNVDVTLPAATKASVRMRSDNGEIYTDFDLVLDPQGPKVTEERSAKGYRLVVEKELQGRINGGGPEFHFKTFNGNIYIRRAK